MQLTKVTNLYGLMLQILARDRLLGSYKVLTTGNDAHFKIVINVGKILEKFMLGIAVV